jgi:CBS domain-containing protein
MNRIPLLKTEMTPFPWWVGIDDPLLTAREMMRQHKVRHLPVKEHGELVSVVTDRDLKFVLDPDLGLPPRESMRVRDVCVYTAYIVDIETRLEAVLDTMAERDRLGARHQGRTTWSGSSPRRTSAARSPG